MPQDDRHLMDPKALKQLDSLFGAFEIVAEGAYVYLCDMHYDLSRWSTTAVDFFDLPGEYMAKAGDIWEDHIHPDDRESFHRSIDNIFSGNESGHDMQYRARTRDGSYVVCTCRGVIMRDADGKPHYFGGAITNHGIRSHIDHLTGLRNQYGFFEDLNTVLQRRRKTLFLMLGLNKFSQINNTYGYEIGNRVLQTVGRELMQRVANRGMVFRLDGARFLVQSQTMAGYEAEDFCADLRDKFRQDYSVDGRKLMLDFSAALLVLDSFDADALCDIVRSGRIIASQEHRCYAHSFQLFQGLLRVLPDGIPQGDKAEELFVRSHVNDGCALIQLVPGGVRAGAQINALTAHEVFLACQNGSAVHPGDVKRQDALQGSGNTENQGNCGCDRADQRFLRFILQPTVQHGFLLDIHPE